LQNNGKKLAGIYPMVKNRNCQVFLGFLCKKEPYGRGYNWSVYKLYGIFFPSG